MKRRLNTDRVPKHTDEYSICPDSTGLQDPSIAAVASCREPVRWNRKIDPWGDTNSLDSLEGVPPTTSSPVTCRANPVPVTKGGVMGPAEWLLLITLSILWGGSFFFGKIAVAEIKPFTVVLGRVGLAALALNILAYLRGYRIWKEARIWGAFFLMGMINNLIPFSLIFWGQTHIACGLASILNATTPLFTVILAHFMTADEPITKSRICGVLLGLLGVAVMIGLDALHGIGMHILGELAVIGAAVSYASAAIFGRRFRTIPPLLTATGQVSATTIMMLPIVSLVDRPWVHPLPSPETVGAVLSLGLLCTALAYTIYFRILAVAGATNVLLVTFLIPVSALLLGTIILGERPAAQHFAGMFLIVLGLAAIDGRLLARLGLRHKKRLRSAEAAVISHRRGSSDRS